MCECALMRVCACVHAFLFVSIGELARECICVHLQVSELLQAS